MNVHPVELDLKKDEGLTIRWSDGVTSFYPVAYLRKHSPAADNRQLQRELARNPLAVLPSSAAGQSGPLRAENAKLVGNYAVRIFFSDGHSAGYYTWEYLREIDPSSQQDSGEAEGR